MIDRRLRDLWDSLLGRKPHMPHFLEKATLTDIRGIYDLDVRLEYPVSVLAGSNGSGKSTMLLAMACAYVRPGTGKKWGGGFSPISFFSDSQSKFTFFPEYRLKPSGREDEDTKGAFTVGFQYSTPSGQCSLRMQDYKDRKGVYVYEGSDRPERSIYLIIPENLINPAEGIRVRNMLHDRHEDVNLQQTLFTPSQIAFAQKFLPFRYSRVVSLSCPNLKFGSKNNLLLAERENGVVYSELHMAAGERTILRLSQAIPKTQSGLILIDEVETGLHPSLQKSLMLELQQLALRNNLQVIVTTHSPVVLDSVPPIGRIFLDRNEDGSISVHPPYLDLVQDALYGRSDKKFNLLCEDDGAKSILEGVVDTIMCNSHLRAKRESLNIEYTEDGASQFPMYAQVLEQFGQNMIFVLDGDQRNKSVVQKIHSRIQKMQNRLQKTQNSAQQTEDSAKHPERVMFLPGTGAPEEWVWERVRAHPNDFTTEFGLNADDLAQQIQRGDANYDSAGDRPSDVAKNKLYDLSEVVKRSVPEICRIVSRQEAKRTESDIQLLVTQLEDAFQVWRGETEETD